MSAHQTDGHASFYPSTIPKTEKLNPETGLVRIRTYIKTSWNIHTSQSNYYVVNVGVNNIGAKN